MTTEEKIKAIHNSDLFGVIIENGAGCCISNSLYAVEGASKTIYYSKQPYSKEYQHETYKLASQYRSVSREFLYELMEDELDIVRDLKGTEKINFILTTSFQLQSENDNTLTHGWIGFEYSFKEDINDRYTEFYHLSLPGLKSREYYFNTITQTAINLLYSKINKNYIFCSSCIDNIVTVDEKGEQISDIADKYSLIENLKNIKYNFEGFCYFKSNGKVLRFEDLCRDQEGIILVKGSFNPLHHGHIALLEQTKKLYSSYKAVFYISIGNRDKDEISTEELLTRIQTINHNGYGVVLSKQSKFNDNLEWIRHRYKLPIIFPVGADTINRFIEDFVKEIEYIYEPIVEAEDWANYERPISKLKELWMDSKFLVFNRKNIPISEDAKQFEFIQIENNYEDDGVSSTKIRNGEFKN